MNCQICGQPMRQIPAGISRSTGKPYDSFMACPNKCKQSKSNYNQPTYVKPYDDLMAKKAENIAESQGRKEESIREAGAKRDAGMIVAAMIHVGELKSSDWFIQYKEVADKVFNHRLGGGLFE